MQRLKGSDVCLGFFSLHPKSPLTTSSETHTSNVCFKDRCIDINIEVHPLLQHVDNSLEFRNISQDLQGNRESGLEFTGEKKKSSSIFGADFSLVLLFCQIINYRY